MKYITLIIFFFSVHSFGQFPDELEKNENLKKYKEVVKIFFYNGDKESGWSRKLILQEGKIYSAENYFKSSLTQKINFNYDLKNNVDFEIIVFERDKGEMSDTTKYSYSYNVRGQLVCKNDGLWKETFSNFNEQNLPRTIESENTLFYPYKIELIYNSTGNIIEQKEYSKDNDKIQIDTQKFKYDDFNNIVEVSRSSEPKREYPIMMLGGRSQYEFEEYEYVYNSDHLWTKKYWIVEGEEHLIEKREFIKTVSK